MRNLLLLLIFLPFISVSQTEIKAFNYNLRVITMDGKKYLMGSDTSNVYIHSMDLNLYTKIPFPKSGIKLSSIFSVNKRTVNQDENIEVIGSGQDKSFGTKIYIFSETGSLIRELDGFYATFYLQDGRVNMIVSIIKQFNEIQSKIYLMEGNEVNLVEEKDFAGNDFIFPNPAENFIFLSGSNDGKIFNSSGELIDEINTSHEKVKYNISILSPGIYFYRANNEIQKFIVH